MNKIMGTRNKMETKKEKGKSKKRIFTVGVLVDWIESPYHVSLLKGIKVSAIKYDMSILTFVGGAIKSPRTHEGPKNAIYNYVSEKYVDGMILFFGSIGNYCTIEELNEFCGRFSPLPIVSISLKLNTEASIMIDNTEGLKSLINHLVKDHGYRKICMIMGPEENQEALERLKVYKETLKENGIPFDPELTAPGRFTKPSGYKAISLFLDKKKLKIDAVLAANDDMACGAIRALQDRKIIVPNEIAVAGFDDQPLSRYFYPSLTTVKQPLYDQGYQAVQTLYNILNGHKVKDKIILPTQLVSRESCGCIMKDFIEEDTKQIKIDKTHLLELVKIYYLSIEEKNYFPGNELAPEGILQNDERQELVIELIFFGPIYLGLVLLDFEEYKGVSFTEIRRIFLYIVLKNVIYMQNILTQSHNLEKINDELYKTLNTLKETQTKLIQSEKMSALGGLVAGISHEINTPIGISVTAASHLEKITKDFYALYSEDKIKRSDLEKYVKTSLEASEMIFSNLKRSYDLIRSFKQVAVDQSTEEKRRFNVKDYIEQVLLSLKPSLKKTEHIITVNCPKTLEITNYPGALSQILTNLLMNSVIHAYDKGQKGNILIDVSVLNSNIVPKYSDDGKGIESGIIEKIFDPFFTTKRSHGGTGLGLNIVYNIVSQTLNGTIKTNSTLGKGTIFKVIFPLEIKN